MVVAGDLLLARALGVGLNVRVKKTTAITHVLDSGARSNGNLKRAVFADLGSLQVGLEERAHLGIAGTGGVENGEVQSKREHVDEERNDDESHDTSGKVSGENGL